MSRVDEAISAYRAGTEANDIDAVMETVSPDVELVSPLSGRMIFRGEQDLRILLTAIYGSIHHLQWREEIGGDTQRVVLGAASVLGVKLTDAMVLDLTSDGQIRRIRPHLRPWLALTLLAVRLTPTIARHPLLVRRALLAG